MTAGEVNKIAKQFLPTMGKKATASKERNKAAMTDSAINLEATAARVGATLPADVRRVLQAPGSALYGGIPRHCCALTHPQESVGDAVRLRRRDEIPAG